MLGSATFMLLIQSAKYTGHSLPIFNFTFMLIWCSNPWSLCCLHSAEPFSHHLTFPGRPWNAAVRDDCIEIAEARYKA